MKFHRPMRRLAPILLLVLVAFSLRVYLLDSVSLRGDESFTVLFVQKPFAQMWNEIRTVEPNPPLMYLLLRGWVSLAGAGEFATRFFSVFWGVLCVPLIYRLARSMTSSPHGRWAGGEVMALAAAFIVTINPYQIWHSQDVRNYTMWPALSLLALIFFWDWIHSGTKPQPGSQRLTLLAFILAELAALYTHYYETFILVALNLYALFYFTRRRAWFARKSPSLLLWVGAQVMLVLLYLPFPLLLSNRVTSYGEGSGLQGIALWDIWQRTFSVFTLGETYDESVRRLAWIPFALALALIFAARWRAERRGVFFLLYIGVPTIAVFLLSISRPLFLERYLNGIAPAYYLLFAWGFGALITSPYPRLVRRGAAFAALAVFVLMALLALTGYYYNPVYAKAPDWRALAQAIDAGARKGDVILQNFPETTLVYYDRSGLPLVVYPETYLPDAQTASALAGLNGKYRRVWFVPSSNEYWDPYQYVEGWLDRHDDLQVETRVSSFRLELYETPTQFLATMLPTDTTVGKFADLVGYRSARAGPVWHLVLYWRARTSTNKRLDVFVNLTTADGSQVLAHMERPPVNSTFPTNQWRQGELVVDQYDLPYSQAAGAVSVGMFDPATSTRLAVFDSKGNPRGDAITLPLANSP